tara:strand:+ start:18487 stop:19005 length:519 start_codon:yes stop_codon:yes gene_type:complete
MAIISVALSDTFDTWRTKTNSLATNQGDMALLDAGFAGSDLVSCLNEIRAGEEFVQIDLPDSTSASVGRIKLGDGDDGQIYYDGTELKIDCSTGITLTGLITGTDNAAGKIMVANGTQYQNVAMSGDATIASGGSLTIASGAVTSGKMASGVSLDIIDSGGTTLKTIHGAGV